MRWLRHNAITLLKIGVSGFLVLWLLQRIGIDSLLEQLMQVSWVYMGLSILSFMVSNVLGAFQWYLLLRNKKVDISLTKTVSFYHVGLFFNNFLVGNMGGDAFRIYDIRRLSGEMNGAFSTVFFDRFVGFFTLSTLALFMAAFYMKQLIAMSTVMTTILMFVAWVLGIFFLFSERFALKFAWLFRLLLPKILHIKAKELYYSINQFKADKWLLMRIIFISFCIQTLRILTHFFAAYSVGVNEALFYFFIFIPIVALAAGMPISIGGIGVREQSAVTLFGQIGVVSAQVVAFEFLAYLVAVVVTLPGGLIFAFRREGIKS